jgi:hypothetical protein
MTAEDLRQLAKRQPFQPFTIYMNDGSRLKVTQPDDIFMHRTWMFEAIVILGGGRWTIVSVRNIAHVTTSGKWPKVNGRKRRGGSAGAGGEPE